MEIDKMISLKY